MRLFSNNPDFYPTPNKVIEQMMMGEDFIGKTILEPSAGSGNIVKWLTRNGAGRVIACENDPQCRRLLNGQCDIIGSDFLTVTADQVSHVQMIVMNPPFSRGADHIMHAFEIAPAGCTIIALCNSNSISGQHYWKQNNRLAETIDLYGNSERLGAVFAEDAERTTRCDVSLVKLYKQGDGEDEFSGYFFSSVDEDAIGNGSDGLIQYNFVRDIVNRYVQAVRTFDSVMQASQQINEIADFYDFETVTDEKTGETKQVKRTYGSLPIRFGAIVVKDEDNRKMENGTAITHQQYKKTLQKHYWKIIFRKLNMEKYATTALREQINRFVEQQQNVPFTMGNIYRVIDIVIQTNGQRMQKALLEAFDAICSFSAENSTAGETWKTNANYMVNRKFIVPWITEVSWGGGFSLHYWSSTHDTLGKIEDVVKALCTLKAIDYDSIGTLRQYVYKHQSEIKWGEWFEWGFFRCKGYKKGTMHFEFLDEDLWYKFNAECARQRGWNLPKKTQKTRSKRKTA